MSYLKKEKLCTFVLVTIILFSLGESGWVYAQEPQKEKPQSQVKQDSVLVFYARDSLIFHSTRLKEKISLYGSASLIHPEAELIAGFIELDFKTNEAHAQHAQSIYEKEQELPKIKFKEDEVVSSDIRYNYHTKKGKFRIAKIDINEGEYKGSVIGDEVKFIDKIGKDVVYIRNGKFSTCPPNHWYFYIKAKKIKIVGDEELFFSDAMLYILDIPYPFLFPLGYFPLQGQNKKQSGLLWPEFIFENRNDRGLGLQKLGWFQYFSDYITGFFQFNIYTSGEFSPSLEFRYNKRYTLRGAFKLSANIDRNGLEPSDPDFVSSFNYRINWNHNHTIDPYSNIAIQLNYRSPNYNLVSSYDISTRGNTNASSTLNYSYKHPDNLYSLTTSFQQIQYFETGRSTITGPTILFKPQKTIIPFKPSKNRKGKALWYETLSIRYNGFELSSRYDFNPDTTLSGSKGINWLEALFDIKKYEMATGQDNHISIGARHNVNIRMNNIIPNKYINSSFSFNYREYWYGSTIEKALDEKNRIITSTVRGIQTARDFNISINMNTKIYGFWGINAGSISSIRHTITPSIGLSFRPDFSSSFWGGYYRDLETSEKNFQSYSIFEGAIYGGPPRGEQKNISFSLNNRVELKTSSRDSLGEVKSNITVLLEQLIFRASYNFAAKSNHLSPLSLSFITGKFLGLAFRGNASFDFYALERDGSRKESLLVHESGYLLRLENFSINTGINLGKKGKPEYNPSPYSPYDPRDLRLFKSADPNYNYYPIMNNNLHWSANLNIQYRWRYNHNERPVQGATINASNISFYLGANWRFSTTLGYDIIEKELTPARFRLRRDMKCWDFSFEINPFGELKYYFFKLSLKSIKAVSDIFKQLPLLKELERRNDPIG